LATIKQSPRAKVAAAITSISEDAYLAGLIDGEGSICIYKQSRKYLGLNLCIVTTDRIFATRLAKTYGFAACSSKRHLDNPKWSQAYVLQVRGKWAVALLRRAMPYLLLKRPQAQLAIEFMDTVKVGGISGRPRSSPHYSQQEAQKRMDMRNEMMRLNARRSNGPLEN
jgi:hypothetical protein